MSHLKKLSDRLARKYVPRVLPIATLETLGSNMLEMYSSRTTNITKGISEFIIPSLRLTASHNNLCSLSSNQLNLHNAVFVIHKNLEDNKWTGYKAVPEDYLAYVNPQILSVEDPLVSAYETCPSIPFIKAKIQRHSKVKVQYQDPAGEYIEEKLEGFRARVFMHEFDHLESILISSYSINFGEVEVVDQEKYKEVHSMLIEFKSYIDEMVDKLEDRYLSDKKFKKNADRYGDKTEYFIEQIVDENVDAEFHLKLRKALLKHINFEKYQQEASNN